MVVFTVPRVLVVESKLNPVPISIGSASEPILPFAFKVMLLGAMRLVVEPLPSKMAPAVEVKEML